MRYADDLITNEQQKQNNGEREIVTLEMLEHFLSDNNEYVETLLDILNNQYSVSEAVNDMKHYYADYLGSLK